MSKVKLATIVVSSTVFGVLVGAYLFSDTQARSFLTILNCETCLNRNEFLGLVASVGIQRAPSLLPDIVKETDKSIAILHPEPTAPFHFVIIPKKDIKDLGNLSKADEPYVVDAFAVARELVSDSGITEYRMWTSGPGFQDLTYLHFHLAGS